MLSQTLTLREPKILLFYSTLKLKGHINWCNSRGCNYLSLHVFHCSFVIYYTLCPSSSVSMPLKNLSPPFIAKPVWYDSRQDMENEHSGTANILLRLTFAERKL